MCWENTDQDISGYQQHVVLLLMHVQKESLVESSKLGRAKEVDTFPLFGYMRLHLAWMQLMCCCSPAMETVGLHLCLWSYCMLQILLQADDAMLVLLVSSELLSVPSDHFGISVMCLLLRGGTLTCQNSICHVAVVCAQPSYIMFEM